MIRRSGGAGVRRFAQEAGEADPNPLETVANLSDVMLVLAVALMIALISHWGVDVTQTQIDEESLQEMDAADAEALAESAAANSGNTYEEVGTVYRDVETGEVYVLSN